LAHGFKAENSMWSRRMAGKVRATIGIIGIIGIIGALIGANYLTERLPPFESFLSTASEVRKSNPISKWLDDLETGKGKEPQRNASKTKPSFRVTFAQEPETTFAASECGPSVGGGCRYDRPVQRLGLPRLKIQSLNDTQIQLEKVVVNDNEKCTVNPVRKITEALKSEGRDVKALNEMARVIDHPTDVMKYGDITTITLSGCTPARVRIVTDRGEVVYDMYAESR
jgi:hypothetical protein